MQRSDAVLNLVAHSPELEEHCLELQLQECSLRKTKHILEQIIG